MKLFDEAAAAKLIIATLKKHYPDKDWKETEKNVITYIENLLVWSMDSATQNEMINYLLSLNDETIYSFLWNKCYSIDDDAAKDAYKDLLIKVEEAKKVWTAEIKEYSSNKKLWNRTQPISCGELQLIPTTENDHLRLLETLATDTDPIAADFDPSIKAFNQHWKASFTIWDSDNELVGFIALDDISGLIATLPTYNTYNLEYYICPAFRGKKYTTTAIRGLLDAAFSGKIIMTQDGEAYGKRYTCLTIPMEIKIVKVLAHTKNVPSIRAAISAGFEDHGSILTANEDNVITEFKNLIMVNDTL